MQKTLVNDIHVTREEVLITPKQLKEELPVAADVLENVRRWRGTIADIIHRRDPRLLVVVGPCSIHDLDAAREYAAKLKQLHDELADSLFENPDNFAPIYEIGDAEDDGEEEQIIVDEWCYGYMRGVELHEKDWQVLLDQQPELLTPMLLFSGFELDGGEQPGEEDLEVLRESIPDLVFAVRDFWLAEAEKPKAPKTGRNDPCPCGSGKKFQQCCLH